MQDTLFKINTSMRKPKNLLLSYHSQHNLTFALVSVTFERYAKEHGLKSKLNVYTLLTKLIINKQ